MNVVDLIQNSLNPLTILNHYGFRQITETNDSIRACCEIHKGNNPTAFIWNKANNLWFCYTGDCGGGDVFTLAEKMEGVDFKTSVIRIANILGLDIAGMKITNSKNRILNEQKKWIELQKKRQKQTNIGEYKLPFTKYYNTNEKFNRFSEDVLEQFGAKFCKLYPLENTMLYHKLVIPLYKDGKLVGTALRDTAGFNTPKWLYQPAGLKINSLLYNLDNVLNMDDITEVVLVEGIFDVWAYHKIGVNNVVAILGSSLKEDQFKQLLKLPINIIMSFDGDDAGKKCTKEVAKKFKNKTQIYEIKLPEGKDPADCTKDELMNLYLNRTLYKQE